MPLLPTAAVKGKIDYTRSRIEWKRQFQVSPTANIVEEGSLLQRIVSPGGMDEVVTLSTAAAAQRPAGVSLQSRISGNTFTAVQDVVVPHVAPFTVQLAHTTLTPNVLFPGYGEAVLYDLTAPGWLAVGVAAPGVVDVNVNGLLTFDPAGGEADHVVRVTYRYTLTSIERDDLLRQSHVNRGAEDQFGLMTVAIGECVIYTTMFRCDEQYAVGDVLTLDAAGLFSKSGATFFGVVISVPTPSDPYLGVEYLTPA